MEIANSKDFRALLDLENLLDLISVDVSFENGAKLFLKQRSSIQIPQTYEIPPKETAYQKPPEVSQAKRSPVLLPSRSEVKESTKPVSIDIPTDKKLEIPEFSATTIALSERGFHNLHFAEKIPDDSAARIIKQHYLWKYPDVKVILLTFTQDTQEKQLWKRLSEALCNLRCKSLCIDALTIDHSAKWKCLFDNPFTLVLAPVKTILRIPALAASYTFSPHINDHHLFGIKLFPLKLGHQYLEQPDLKKELWTQLCRMLALPKSP